jgi:phosphatidylserine/phosphatidylglycerophosphate/cardiolipin synthase-like enzyme
MSFAQIFGQPHSKRRLGSYIIGAVSLLTGLGYLSFLIYGNKSNLKLQKLAALPQHSKIQVFMNHSEANSYTDPYRKIERSGDNLEQILIDQILSAKSSVEVAVQEIRLPNIVNALVRQKQAGIKVRLVIENSYNRGVQNISDELPKMSDREKGRYADLIAFTDLNRDDKLSTDEVNQRDAIAILKNAGIEYIDDTADGSSGAGLMHHKFVVIDRQKVVVTSANFTLSDIHGDFLRPDTRGNSNNMLTIDSKELAEAFGEEFDLMWRNHLFGTKKPPRKVKYILLDGAQIRLKFSPDKPRTDWEQTSNGLIGTTLSSAEKSADMALFVFAEPRLGNILDSRNQQKVEIRALVDPSFAYREYATTLDMWGYVSTQDCKIGNAKPWQTPIKSAGIPSLPKGDILHHKVGLVDHSTVITGSHNWSATANFTNDETLIVIQNSVVAAHYLREFERLFDGAILGPNQKIRDRANTVCPVATQAASKRLSKRISKKSVGENGESLTQKPRKSLKRSSKSTNQSQPNNELRPESNITKNSDSNLGSKSGTELEENLSSQED